ncbi:RNA polymerase factor sigma-32, partial [mine drainage metagenome]
YLEDHSADPYRAVAEADQEGRDLGDLRLAMTRLDARAQDIIRRRWLDDASKVTLQELADEYGVSAERIRQIEASALKKMRASFAA